MFILAAALTLGIDLEINLSPLLNRHFGQKASAVTCGIKTVGYRFNGRPGQQFGYAGETFTIPAEGYVEVISFPKVKTYSFAGQKLPLDGGTGPLDGFSFRWIDLATTSTNGENHQ